MTREIKFRAWDRKKKQFDTCRNGGDIMSFSLDYKGIQEVSRPFKVYQQFTGLHDKNGKEIYEGDILKYHECYVDASGKLIDAIKVVSIPNFYKDEDYVRCMQLEVGRIKKGVEIIGNIYENPNLLK